MAIRQLADKCWRVVRFGKDPDTGAVFQNDFGVLAAFAIDPVRQLFAWSSTGEQLPMHIRHFARAVRLDDDYICVIGDDGTTYQFFSNPSEVEPRYLDLYDAWAVNGGGWYEVDPEQLTLAGAANAQGAGGVPAEWLAQAALNFRAALGRT